MQPEPIESSTNTPELNAPESSSTPQYGIHPLPQPPAVLHDSREQHVDDETAAGEQHADAVVESAALEEEHGLQEQVRGLNIQNADENRPRPSFQLISEYENALSPSPARKSSEGLGFKVVKKKGHRLDGPKLENFPNGTVPGRYTNSSWSLSEIANVYQRS